MPNRLMSDPDRSIGAFNHINSAITLLRNKVDKFEKNQKNFFPLYFYIKYHQSIFMSLLESVIGTLNHTLNNQLKVVEKLVAMFKTGRY
jgi:hypothetical protein